MPGRAISSSLVAVLRLTAATAHCDKSASARTTKQRNMMCLLDVLKWRRNARRFHTLRRRQLGRYQTFDIAGDAVGNRNKAFRIPRGAELGQIGFGEAMVFADKLRRKRGIDDSTLAHMFIVRCAG